MKMQCTPIAGFVFFLACIVTTIVIVVGMRVGRPNPTTTPRLVLPPTPPIPTPTPSRRFQVIRQRLEDAVGFSFDDDSSAQFRTLEWLVNDDPAMLPELSTPLTTLVERYVVALLKFGMNRLFWSDQLNFLTSSSICEWNNADGNVLRFDKLGNGNVLTFDKLGRGRPVDRGIFCNEEGQVNAISLGLTGTIPTELGNLQALQYLWLLWNVLTGTIPTEIGNLQALQLLGLELNYLSGTIPTEVGNMQALQKLYLIGNQLTGTIPTEVGNMQALNTLELDYNELTGTIPTEVGNMQALQDLELDENQLTGTIPTEIGNLDQLEWASFESNLLNGAMPQGVCLLRDGNLTRLIADCDSSSDPRVECNCCTRCW